MVSLVRINLIKLVTVIVVGIFIFYLGFVALIAVKTIKSYTPLSIIMGCAMLVVVSIGFWLGIVTILTGIKVQKLDNKVVGEEKTLGIAHLSTLSSDKIDSDTVNSLFTEK